MSESVNTPERKKERAFLVFGEPGHEQEYVFTLPYSKQDTIPFDIVDRVLEIFELTDWEVLDRSSRLEIRHKKELGARADELVGGLLQEALGDSFQLFVK